jgi:hypothetical protein
VQLVAEALVQKDVVLLVQLDVAQPALQPVELATHNVMLLVVEHAVAVVPGAVEHFVQLKQVIRHRAYLIIMNSCSDCKSYCVNTCLTGCATTCVHNCAESLGQIAIGIKGTCSITCKKVKIDK